ncbi:MAG: restriction endonuclease subunit S [Myxococcales bacterium]|nr:restriction endonuclease subunit S [Myxococcales bacterium]
MGRPVRWREVRLGDVAEIFDGPHATPHKVEDGPIFLGISNLADGRLDLADAEHVGEDDFIKWTRRVTPTAGDVVFSYETRLGQAAAIPAGLRCCLGRRLGLLRARPGEILPRFLLYTYLGPAFQAEIRARAIRGSTVDRIPLLQMPEFPLRLPPLAEQRRIAQALAAIDEKIALHQQMNETLAATIQALFERWLDAPRRPGWRRGTIGELADAPRRGVMPAEVDPNTPYIGLEHVPRGNLALSSWGRAAEVTSGKFKFHRGELLFGRLRAYFKKVGLAPVDGVCSTDILVVVPRTPEYAGMVLGHLTSDAMIRHVDALSTGTKMPRASWTDVARFPVEVPQPAVAAALTEQATPILGRIVANVHEARALAELRDTLLPRLLGEQALEG